MILTIATAMIVVGLGFVVYRLWRGPTGFDRVLCLDGLSISLIALLAIHGLRTRSDAFMDIVLILAPVNFMATIGFSLYLLRTHRTPDPDTEDATR